MRRTSGLGGIFFKARDPEGLYGWYERHLGIRRNHGVATFKWRDHEQPDRVGLTVSSIFAETSGYFGSPEQRAMINYRVDDLDALLAALAAEGVKVLPERDDSAFGRFAWIVDPEGNRVELWQPPEAQPPRAEGPALACELGVFSDEERARYLDLRGRLLGEARAARELPSGVALAAATGPEVRTVGRAQGGEGG
jgi:predicted enzyme related to lactoylglutathione lyase